MTEQMAGKWRKVALALGLIAGVLALSAALIRYIRFGEVDLAKIAAGIFFPVLIYSITKQNNSRKE